MAWFCFTTEDRTLTVEMEFPVGKAPASVELHDGVLAFRDLGAENIAIHTSSGNAWRGGLHSDSMGVNPKQIPAMMERDKKHGVPTEYDGQGRPILRSRKHRKEYAKSRGFFDRDGGYSDP